MVCLHQPVCPYGLLCLLTAAHVISKIRQQSQREYQVINVKRQHELPSQVGLSPASVDWHGVGQSRDCCRPETALSSQLAEGKSFAVVRSNAVIAVEGHVQVWCVKTCCCFCFPDELSQWMRDGWSYTAESSNTDRTRCELMWLQRMCIYYCYWGFICTCRFPQSNSKYLY